MNLQTLPAVCLLLAALTLPGEAAKPNEAIPWNAHADPSPHPIDWTPKADLTIDLRPLGGSVVHPPTLTPYVLINATWMNQESPVYDLRTGEIVGRAGRATERAGAGLFCALSPNGRWVAMARGSQSSVWSTESGAKRLELPVADVREIRFVDDRRLITFHGQYGVKVWSIPEGELLVEFDLPRSAYKRAMDTTPGGNYLFVVAKHNDSRSPQVVAIDLRTGATAGAVSLPQPFPHHVYDLDVSFDGTSFACLWANRDGAFLTAWEMEGGHQIVQHRLADKWKEFAERFDQARLPRGDWDAAKLCWKPDNSGWLVTAAIHVDRETGTASPILLPKPWFGSQGGRTPRHLPGNHVVNVLGERPEGLLTVVKYDPIEFPKLRQAMEAGYLPEDFSRPELIRLPPADALPLHQLLELTEAAPAYTPEVPMAARALPERVELEFPPKHASSQVGVRDMWQPTECGGDLFVSFGRQFTKDSVFWRLSRYDCRSQKETARFTAPFQARPVDVSPSGKTVLTRTEDGRFDLWRFSGEHLLGFRPQWPTPRQIYSLRDLPVALVDDERFLQVDDSRTMVIRTLPDGKAVHRVATEFGRYDLPSFDRRAVLLFRKFGWDVFNVDTGEIAHQITLPKDVQGLHHQAVFSPSGKQVALILPIELPERTNKTPNVVQGRLSRSLSVIDVVSGRETMALSLPQRYKKSPLWVSEEFLLIDSPLPSPSETKLPKHGHQHLLIHGGTGCPVWRYLTRDYLQRVRSSDRTRGVWWTRMADPWTPRPGRIVGCSLLTPEVLLAAGKQLEANRPLVDNLTRLDIDVALELPTELEPLRTYVYRHDNASEGFMASSESMTRHFQRLLEDQGIASDPGAHNRLSVKLVEKPLARLVDRKDLAGFRAQFDCTYYFSGESPWLKERLNKEGAEISATEVICTITISGREGEPLAQVQRVFNTFDSGFLERSVRDDETIRDRLRKNVWQGAAIWCLNLSAQSILTGTFDERQIPTTRLDGGEVQELDKPATFPVPSAGGAARTE